LHHRVQENLPPAQVIWYDRLMKIAPAEARLAGGIMLVILAAWGGSYAFSSLAASHSNRSRVVVPVITRTVTRTVIEPVAAEPAVTNAKATSESMPVANPSQCAALGGEFGRAGNLAHDFTGILVGTPSCINIPYIGTDGMTYRFEPVGYTLDGSLDKRGLNTNGTGATAAECRSGHYPMANPGVDNPGKWNNAYGFCTP